MDPHAHDSYLESQVMTATPQKLRLMLIDGAMGAGRQAIGFWEAGDNERASAAITRCRNIISELLAGIKPDSTPLTKRVAGVYVFLFKLMTEAQLHQQPELIRQALEILSVEQETWRMVCEKMPNAPLRTLGESAQELTSSDAARMLPAKSSGPATYEPTSEGGFTIDA